ncbi:hypothetical protein BGZ95_009173 [Linnemannia exigua]|uniref:Uncharacterized protein n=1 Tax=Linnemannia exigua TaxID=604196 RepID=A0AAD4DF03_9FUNG|nr:hypothetical protein BGZ95_009173 [Linnemannia exigua]
MVFIRATSAQGSDKEYKDDDTLPNNQEGDRVLVDLDSPTHPQRTPSDAIPSDGPTDPLNNLTLVDSMFSSGGGGLISPTSLSPTSMSPTSLMYPTTPPSSKPKKPGFLKSTLNRLSGRQLVSPISPTPGVETDPYTSPTPAVEMDSYQSVFLFPSHPPVEPLLSKPDLLFHSTQDDMMQYQPPPPTDFDPQGQDSWAWQWNDGLGWVSLKSSYPSAALPVEYGIAEDVKIKEESEEEDVVDYVALFQKIEADRARRMYERQKALDESARPKSIYDEPDTHVVPYHPPPGAIPSAASNDS